jgi:DNA-binding PadR family transcriptional regulator
MYELFLLGKLMDRPWHGYEFQRVLNSFVGPMRKVSWGTVYPMLRRLEKAGLIERAPSGPGPDDKRGRQRYSITAAGKRRFLELMRPEQLNTGEYRETFRIVLGNLGRVDAEMRSGIVAGYLQCVSAAILHAEKMARRVRDVAELRESEREDILLALERDRFLAEADRGWILEKMDDVLKSG